jgi:RecA-family ATPase
MQGNIEQIEQAFLGCLISSDEAFKKSQPLLSAYFSCQLHGEIYDRIFERYKNGEAVEVRLLALEFENHHSLSEVGSATYMRDLADSPLSTLAAPDYASEIYKAHCKRALAARTADCDGSSESLNTIAKLLTDLANAGADMKSRRLKPHSWQDLKNIPERPPLIKGILDRRAMSVVYGESNCGKTFLSVDMALHITLGRPWHGHRTQQGNVLYVAAEGGLSLAKRLQTFALYHNLTENPPIHLISTGIDLCNTSVDAQEIIREARILGHVELIVIDTLSRAMSGGNENSPEGMGAFVKNCDTIREQTGAHVLIVHHAGKDTTKGSRGHSSLRAAADTEIEVIQNKGVVTAEIKKQRDGRTGDKFSFTLESIQLGMDEEGDQVTSCVLISTETPAKVRKKLSPQNQRALDVLNNLMTERGERGIPKTGMRTVTFVRNDDFRAALLKANISASDKPDNVRRQIQRIMETLNDNCITATWEDKVWVVGQAGQ